MSRLRWLRRMVIDLPRNLELAYCLLRDPRVPARNKAALAAALVLIVSPLDVPAWVPVVGEGDILLLTLLATGLFVDTAPDDVVEEQRRLIALHQSRFDLDVAGGQRLAVRLARLIRRERPADSWQLPAGEVAGVPVTTQPGAVGPTADEPIGVSQ